MKQSGVFIKLMSVLLAFCFTFTVVGADSVMPVSGAQYDENYENMSSAEKQAYLEQKLKELNQKLSVLGEQSKETEDYINVLDEKIGFLQKQLQLSKNALENSKKSISALEKQYSSNEKEIAELQQEIVELGEKQKEQQAEFDISYEHYAERAKAMYISGNVTTLSMILSSEDISTLFTRLEMVRRVSNSDKQLLEGLQNEGEQLMATKSDLQEKTQKLTANQETLVKTKEKLDKDIKALEAQQLAFNEKEKTYKTEKDRADQLLLQLHNDTQTYSEFRNQDLQELSEINAEIERAAQEWLNKQENTTTTTTTTTTTEKPSSSDNSTSATKKPTTTETTKKTTQESSTLKLTYPVPSQTNITCGWHGYEGHTGVDFACNSNSRVVAAEDGEVIISTDLTNPNGSYRSYGRYIVIAHTKKNAAGNYVFTLYAHNSTRVVSKGDKVTKGQLIAYSGSTGNSTGPHCHFEVRTPTAEYKDCVNPTPYLP